jgi:hypothetical protein
MMVQSGDEYREKNRKRVQRFFDKQMEAGKRRITAMISGEAYERLLEAREQGYTLSAAVDLAIKGKSPGEALADLIPLIKAARKRGHDVDAIMRGLAERDPVTVEDLSDRDADLIRIYESLPGPKNAQARADALNEAGLPVKGGVWNKKNAGDLYRIAKKKTGGA